MKASNMSAVFLIILIAVCTAFVWYQTIQGYRTGVLNVRTRIDRRVSPRQYFFMLMIMIILCLLMLVSVVLITYGETHPDWHAKKEVRSVK